MRTNVISIQKHVLSIRLYLLFMFIKCYKSVNCVVRDGSLSTVAEQVFVLQSLKRDIFEIVFLETKADRNLQMKIYSNLVQRFLTLPSCLIYMKESVSCP
jgi:hypothetical protein